MSRCSALALIGAIVFSRETALADVELPLLHVVTKTLVFNDDVPPEDLLRFKEVQNLVLEIHMRDGNMVRDRLVSLLHTDFPSVTKRFVVTPRLQPAHISQLRRIDGLEVVLLLNPESRREEIDILEKLGPVRKQIEIPPEFDVEALGHRKNTIPTFRLKDRLDERIAHWIEQSKNQSVRFVLGPDTPPALAYELLRFRPLAIEIGTVKNRIPPPLLTVLRDFRGVSLTIAVDGRLTLEDVRTLTQLEDFSLKIDLTQPVDVVPGMPAFLNRIAPP